MTLAEFADLSVKIIVVFVLLIAFLMEICALCIGGWMVDRRQLEKERRNHGAMGVGLYPGVDGAERSQLDLQRGVSAARGKETQDVASLRRAPVVKVKAIR